MNILTLTHRDKKGIKMVQHQGHLFKHHKCTQQEPMWQILEGHHLNQKISDHLNFHSCLNQITGQQGNQVNQKIQLLMEDNLM